MSRTQGKHKPPDGERERERENGIKPNGFVQAEHDRRTRDFSIYTYKKAACRCVFREEVRKYV